MVNILLAVGACVLLVGLGFFVAVFGFPLTLLLCLVLAGLAFLARLIYRSI